MNRSSIATLLVTLCFPVSPALATDAAVARAHYAEGRYADAYREFRGLAEVGYTRYLNRVASMHARGEGVAKDPVEAYAWYALSASQGDPEAQAQIESLRQALTATELQRGHAMALEYGGLYVAPYRPNWRLD